MSISKPEQLITIDTNYGPVEIGVSVAEAIEKLATHRGTDFSEAINHLFDQGLSFDEFALRVIEYEGDAMISMPARDTEPAFDVRFSGHDVLNPKRFGKFLSRTQAIFS